MFARPVLAEGTTVPVDDLRCQYPTAYPNAATFNRKLLAIPGELATGLFYDMASLALVADEDAIHELRVD